MQLQRQCAQHDAGLVFEGITLGIFEMFDPIEQSLPGNLLLPAGDPGPRAGTRTLGEGQVIADRLSFQVKLVRAGELRRVDVARGEADVQD